MVTDVEEEQKNNPNTEIVEPNLKQQQNRPHH